MSAGLSTAGAVALAPPAVTDLREGARILFEAFAEVHDFHRFPGAYPSREFAADVLARLIAHAQIHGLGAYRDGALLGTGFIDERGPIRGIGPISVDPSAQGRGAGRMLVQALLERTADARGVRLLQDAFNRASLALYLSLGFELQETTLLFSGRVRAAPPSEVQVRALGEGDLEECERLCVRVHGYERTAELRDALDDALCAPLVALRGAAILAYTTTLSYFPAAHCVAADEQSMRALIVGGAALTGGAISLLIPAHQTRLVRWLLAERLRVMKTMSYMTIGAYRRPRGCWVPSVSY